MLPQPILIADDTEGDVAILTHQLASAKILNAVQSVSDGEQTMCYLQGKGKFADREKYPYPVLLFLDLRMPRVGGYEILSFLRASPQHQNLPVVVLSVFSELKSVNETYQLGANWFLVKPITTHDLVCTFRAIKHIEMRLTKEGFWLETN